MAEQEYIQIKLKIDAKESEKIQKLTGILAQQKALLKAYSVERDKAFSQGKIAAYSKEIGTLRNAIDKSTVSIEKQQKSVFAMGDSLGHVVAKIGLWTIGTGLVFGALSTLKKGISTITEMDTQMVDLQKVFQGTSGELKSLKADLMDNSVAMGSLVDTTMRAAIELGRMGKTRAEIAELTKVSLLAQNIAEIDAGDATRYLNAAVLQFNKSANEALGILDEWNQLSNTTPSRTIDFAQATEHAGAVIRQAKGEIEDLNAYVATLTATMAKSGDEIGQALKTITTYAYRPKTVAKIKGITGLEVIDQQQQLMGIDELLTKLAGRWNTLTEAQQEELAQTIAGVRRKSFFLNLMQNFDLVLDAHAKQWVAAGSAMRENEIRMSSLKTKMDQLTAAMQQFAIQGGDAGILGAMKGMVDQLRDLVINLNNANGMIQLLAVAGIPLATAGFSVFVKKVVVAKAEVSGLAAMFNTLSGKMIMWTAVIGGLVIGINALAKASKSSAANLRAQRNEIEKSLTTIRAEKERQKVILDQYELYQQGYDALKGLEKQNKDTTDAENNLHKIMDEINKLNPDLVSSTDNHTKALKRLAEAAKTATDKYNDLSRTENQVMQNNNEKIIAEQKLLRKTSILPKIQSNPWLMPQNTGGQIPYNFRSPILNTQNILPTNAEEGLESQIQKSKTLEEREKRLASAIDITTKKASEKYKLSKYETTAEIREMNKLIDSWNTELDAVRDSIELKKKYAEIGKEPPEPKPPNPPKTEEELKLEEQLADAKEKHLLAMAQLDERELEYWERRLKEGRGFTSELGNVTDELERQQIIYTIEELKAKHVVDLKDEQLSHEEKMARIKDKELDEDQAQINVIQRQLSLIEAKKVAQGGVLTIAQELRQIELRHEQEQIEAERKKKDIVERRKASEREIKRIRESIKDASVAMSRARSEIAFPKEYNLTGRGAYVYQSMGDPYESAKQITTQIQDQIAKFNELEMPIDISTGIGELFNPDDIVKVVNEIQKNIQSGYSNIDAETITQAGGLGSDLADSAKQLQQALSDINLEFQRQLQNEEWNKQILQDENALLSEKQIIENKIERISEDLGDTEEARIAKLRLQNQLMAIQIRRKQELVSGIADNLDQLIRNWQANKTGKEVGAEFFEGMGSVAGDYLGDLLGQQIGGMIGSTILPGIGGALGSWLGGEIGKLLGYEDKKDEKTEAEKENTRALRENTKAFQDFQEQYYNAPSGFRLESAAKGGLPQFATGGVVERTGYAKVDKGETVMKPNQIRDLITERGKQVFTSNQLNNTHNYQATFGNIVINNPASGIDIQRAIQNGINGAFAGGRQKFQYVSSQYEP